MVIAPFPGMENYQIVAIFRDIASMLAINGENRFRISAYERAAANIEAMGEPLESFVKEDRLREIPGIGHDLAEKIKEFAATGKIASYEELRRKTPEGLRLLMEVPTIGPKTAKFLFDTFKIKNVDELERAIAAGKLRGVSGMKEKTLSNIAAGIAVYRKGRQRMTLAEADQVAEEFVKALRTVPGVRELVPSGSLRRRKETVGDVDILAVSEKPADLMRAFTTLSLVGEVLARGEKKSSVRTRQGIQVDCRMTEKASFGAAILYFTGSKEFNVKLRQMAIRKGWKLNEYGIFKGERMLAGATEEEMLGRLGLPFIDPELREDTGEVEAALEGKLPRLLTRQDIKGDLHVHSHWSDGSNSIEEMATAGRRLGYSYIASTDHSQSLRIAGGLGAAELRKKKREIDRLNAKLKGFRVLYGTEVDIDAEGGLDYDDSVLREFDVVVAALHGGFKQPRRRLTARIVAACRNKYVHIIAHPTGRLRGSREEYDLDFPEIFKAARDTNTCLEINAFPGRLDLNDRHSRAASAAGVKLAVDTDSHLISQMENMAYGVAVARRAWLTAGDVINTLPCDRLLEAIRK